MVDRRGAVPPVAERPRSEEGRSCAKPATPVWWRSRAATSRRSFLRGAGTVALGGGLGASGPFARLVQAAAAEGDAEVIFHGGPVLTMNPAAPRAEALAVKHGLIAAVGARDAVMARRGPGTRVIDLRGRALLPGFIDPHMHTSFVYFDDWEDLGPFANRTIDEAMGKLRAAIGRAEPGSWVRGQLLDPSIMPGDTPTRQSLDALAPDTPVFVLESNGHVAYANSRAFALAGITSDTPDPPQGRYIRDDRNRFTGRLEEGPAFTAMLAEMPQMTPEEYQRRVRALFDRAASVGCTSLHDCGIGLVTGPGDLEAIRAVVQDDPPVRVSGVLVSTLMDRWLEMGLTPGAGSDRLRLTAIKAWADGSNQGLTGYQREPYLNTDARGALNYTPEQITEVVRRAHGLGWQVSVHANGDAAIDTVLRAFDAVLTESPRADHRHRIEHCSVLHPEQMRKMADLGLSPSFLIGHVHYWGKAFRDAILGPERARFYDPCRSALDAGLRISLHSDYNVTPIEPLRFIDNAVNRTMQDGGEVFYPEERITAEEAIRAVTLDAAWQCRKDDIVGSLEVGKYADLVVLERDPTAVEPEAIRSIGVAETWLQGVRRFAA